MRASPGDFPYDFNHAHPPHRYRIGERIGRGGQANVYLGHSLEHPTEDVAVKAFNPVDADMAELQSVEAERISVLDHPNIIKVHWHGTHVIGSGQRSLWRRSNTDAQLSHYVVTEYADGGTLKELAKIDPHPEKIVSAIAHVISGVAYAHGEGRTADAVRIIHRDIKPSNVLVFPKEKPIKLEGFPDLAGYGNAKLSDFGASIYGPGRIVDGEEYTVTTTQIATGTLPYMPPEQSYGKAVPATDDYSIGVMAYYTMTGQLPINVDSILPAPWVKAHENDLVPAFAEIAPQRMNKLYEAVEPAIRRTLAKTPEGRHPSTGDLLEDYRVGVARGMEAMKRDVVHIDLKTAAAKRLTVETTPLGEQGNASAETEQLTEIAGTTTRLVDETVLDPTKKLPEPKRFSRRQMLSGAGALGSVVALEVVNAIFPPHNETNQSPETRTDEQIVTAAAKEVLAAMEANDMSDRAAMLIKQLAYFDPDFAWQKITELQKINDANAPWLAADFTRHSLTKPAAMMMEYKAQGRYDAMAIVAASVAGATIGSHDVSLSEVQYNVEDIISFCSEKPELLPHLKIVSGAFSPNFTIKLHAFDKTYTTATAILNDLGNAGLYWGINALGRALAPNDNKLIRDTIARYDEMAQGFASLEVDLYDLLADLTVALAPFDAVGSGEELANMSSRSTGIADERSQEVAIEIARDNPDAVQKYIDTHEAEPLGARVAAVALAGIMPAKVQSLPVTTLEPVRSWINASLNLRDGHTLDAAVKALTADKNMLKNYGAELAAALLISRRVR